MLKNEDKFKFSMTEYAYMFGFGYTESCPKTLIRYDLRRYYLKLIMA